MPRVGTIENESAPLLTSIRSTPSRRPPLSLRFLTEHCAARRRVKGVVVEVEALDPDIVGHIRQDKRCHGDSLLEVRDRGRAEASCPQGCTDLAAGAMVCSPVDRRGS